MLESTVGKWVFAAAVSCLALLAPIHSLMGAVGALIGADFITGVLAARKRGESITSKAMARTVYKCIAYQLAVVSGFALQHLIGDVLPVAKLAAGAVGLVEFKSLAENVQTLTGVKLDSLLTKIQDRDKP